MKGILFVIGAMLTTQSIFAGTTEFFNCKEIPANEVSHKRILRAGELLIKSEDNFKHFEMKFTYDDEYHFSQAFSCVFRDGAEEEVRDAVAPLLKLGSDKAAEYLVYNIVIRGSNLPKFSEPIKEIVQEIPNKTGDDPSIYRQEIDGLIRRQSFSSSTAVKVLLMSNYKNESVTLRLQ
jgi:hypothetical protein